MITGTAGAIWLEQSYRWAAKISGPVLALVIAMTLSILFCTVMALTNLAVTLLLGKLLRIELEELLLCVNATLGGPPTAAAMPLRRDGQA
jgi:uncharacterized membrane protein